MKKRAFLYIIFTGILWGTSGIFVHYLAPYGITSLQMTAVRGMVSFVCLALFGIIRDRRLFFARRVELLFYFAIGIFQFGTAGCYYACMQMTSVSTAVVLMYTAPVYVMIFSVMFLGKNYLH